MSRDFEDEPDDELMAQFEADFDAEFAEPEPEPEPGAGAVDEEDEPDDEPVRPGHPAAYATNWKTVLVIDSLVGVVLMVAGIVMSIAWIPVIGGFIGSVGLVYVAFIAKRAQEWHILRQKAGLS